MKNYGCSKSSFLAKAALHKRS